MTLIWEFIVHKKCSFLKINKKWAKFRKNETLFKKKLAHPQKENEEFAKKVQKSFDLKTLFHINLPTCFSRHTVLNISYTRRQVQVIEPVISW